MPNENHLAGISVLPMPNANGTLDDGESSTTSDSSGPLSASLTDATTKFIEGSPPDGFVFNRTSLVEVDRFRRRFITLPCWPTRPVTGTVLPGCQQQSAADEGDTFFAA